MMSEKRDVAENFAESEDELFEDNRTDRSSGDKDIVDVARNNF